MPWIKQGLVFAPAGEGGWMTSHAQLPTVLTLPDRLRVYFAARRSDGKGLPTFIDVDRDDPKRILRLNMSPILDFGPPGSFDENGVMPSCALAENGRILLYYIGWSRDADRPYRLAAGLAVSEDGGETFGKQYGAPVIDRTEQEPYLATSPLVVREADTWRVWYTSGKGWVDVQGRLEPIYDIKYGTSRDGLVWHRDGRAHIDCLHPFEAVGRPAVIRDGERYRMWFSCRGSVDYRGGPGSYRIGYAESPDGLYWRRDDSRTGIEVSRHGWDSEMQEYPCVVRLKERLLLFYNGNDFGRTGFGYADWQD